MAMALKNLDTLPTLIPIPELYCHVIGSCENEGLRWVHNNGPNVIWVRFKGGDLL